MASTVFAQGKKGRAPASFQRTQKAQATFPRTWRPDAETEGNNHRNSETGSTGKDLKMSGTPWTPNEEDILLEGAAEGKSPDQISEEINRSPGAIRNKAFHMGITFEKRSMSEHRQKMAVLDQKNQALILDIIRDCIAEGKPMPTNTAIAGRLGLPDKNKVNALLRRLKHQKVITVKVNGPNRVITIRETGEQVRSAPRKHSWGGLKPAKVERADPGLIEEAKQILRRAGFNNVYNAELVHPGDKRCRGKFMVGNELKARSELLQMADRWKARLVA